MDERLDTLSSRSSRFHAGAMTGFAYAFEALETGAYELLARTARRAGDETTAAMAERGSSGPTVRDGALR